MGLFDWFKKTPGGDEKKQTPSSQSGKADGIITTPDGSKVVQTEISHHNAKGWISRGYHAERKEYQMLDSHFDKGLPRWIKDAKVSLVEGKGIPTVLYVDLRAMKLLGIQSGSLKRFVICQVHDWDSVFHLFWLQKRYPEEKLPKLFSKTRLFQSRENVIIQSGHKVVDSKFEVDGAIFNHPQHLVDENFTEEEMNALCKKYEVNQQDMVFWKFSVVIEVEAAH